MVSPTATLEQQRLTLAEERAESAKHMTAKRAEERLRVERRRMKKRRRGEKRYRVCVGCGIRKADTAYRKQSAACMKCAGSYRFDGERGRHACTHMESRTTFAEWMVIIGASAAEYSVVRKALARYGHRGAPSPDDVLEEYVRVRRRPRARYGQLFHATVLLAHERNADGRRELSAGVGSPGRRAA